MKGIIDTPVLVKKMEKDAEGNITGMQLRVWKLRNGTEIVMRMYEHSSDSTYILWNGKRNNGDVRDMVRDLLVSLGIMKDKKNWDYSTDTAIAFEKQDDPEDKDSFLYFAWKLCVPMDF